MSKKILAYLESIVILSIFTVPLAVLFSANFTLYVSNITKFIVNLLLLNCLFSHFLLAEYLIDKNEFRKNFKKEFVIFEIFSIICSAIILICTLIWS